MSDLLAGIRVLESAVLLNGDTLGMHLADLGADVIKIEAPTGGDYLRDILGQIVPGHSPAHLQVNKNKRSMALDLQSDKGREVFEKLAQDEKEHVRFLSLQYDAFMDRGAPDPAATLGKRADLSGPSPIFSESFRSRIKDAHFAMSALSIGASIVTFVAQQRGELVPSTEAVPLALHLRNSSQVPFPRCGPGS